MEQSESIWVAFDFGYQFYSYIYEKVAYNVFSQIQEEKPSWKILSWQHISTVVRQEKSGF